ncbi:unnamed protein product [Rhizophagus irregularis]|nr:unnamed protein product [Rhizophagus irregularis]CAB5209310.1 unnamed protein product [Rhizophagus irregularis]
MCRKQPGIAIGRLCEKCDGKCVICDSYVRPDTLVRICDECNYGSYQGRCVICGAPGVSDAYYCKECVLQEKDRDGWWWDMKCDFVARLVSICFCFEHDNCKIIQNFILLKRIADI